MFRLTLWSLEKRERNAQEQRHHFGTAQGQRKARAGKQGCPQGEACGSAQGNGRGNGKGGGSMSDYELVDMHDVREGDEQRHDTDCPRYGWADDPALARHCTCRNAKGYRGSSTFPTSHRPVFRRAV